MCIYEEEEEEEEEVVVSTSRKARECNRDRRQPIWEALGRLLLSAEPLPSPSRLPSPCFALLSDFGFGIPTFIPQPLFYIYIYIYIYNFLFRLVKRRVIIMS